jgi:hypothetical protein
MPRAWHRSRCPAGPEEPATFRDERAVGVRQSAQGFSARIRFCYSHCITLRIKGCCQMTRRLTISLEDELEQALAEAPSLLDLSPEASDSEKLRAYARLGYERSLDDKRQEQRLATYRAWADLPEMSEVARATFRQSARRGVFRD